MAIEKRSLRDVFGTFVTGVAVITTIDLNGKIHGCTANSFSSVSLEPPLVLWSQAKAARSYDAFADGPRFAVNILSDGQREVSDRFASDASNKFSGVEWSPGNGGVPILKGVCAHIECRKVANYPGGDHSIFLGEVEAVLKSGLRPLVFAAGRYLMATPLTP